MPEVKRFGDVRKHNYSQADHAEYLQNPPYRDHSWFHFDSLCARGFLSLCVSIRGRPSTVSRARSKSCRRATCDCGSHGRNKPSTDTAFAGNR
jgi:hypothetical protein